jgi:tripartite-type tricarboxylate transporter receptor subunit TctC
MRVTFRLLPLLAVLCSASLLPMTAAADDYPSKPIRWVLGYPAGGASDVIARTIVQKLPEVLGQPVLIDNRPGATGIIAGNAVAHAAPDGYTLLLESSGFLVNVAMGRKMAFDPFKDLTAVTELGIVPNIVVVNPESKIHTIKDLIAEAKAQPGKLNFGSGGVGTGTHLATELFDTMTGVDMVHIPYKGTPPAFTALMGGRIQVMFAGAPPALPLIRSGKVRAIAVTSRKRSPVAPDLPTVAESVPGFSGVTWYVLLVPKAVPPQVIAKLNAAFKKVLNDPDMQKTLLKRGFVAEAGDPAEAEKEMHTEVDTYAKIIKKAGIQAH